jgi:drug/metabolite transporter (DMT)-like permease
MRIWRRCATSRRSPSSLVSERPETGRTHVIAILGGFGAAVAWAVATLCSSRSTRLIEPFSVVAWVMIVGLVITAPVAGAEGVPVRIDGSSGLWLAVAGAGSVMGLSLAYAALRVGRVGLVAPVVSTEGAIAALIALLTGESLTLAVGGTLAVIAFGVCLVSVPAVNLPAAQRAANPKIALLAVSAAVAFGTSLYATARAGSALPTAWVVLSARLIGSVAVALPLAATGRLRLTAQALPLVVTSGVCEVLGYYAYTSGSRHGVAIAAVVSSQFAALSALGAYVLFKERLSRIQLLGVVMVIIGVGILSALAA